VTRNRPNPRDLWYDPGTGTLLRAGALFVVLALPLVALLTACPRSGGPPPPTSGVVVDVDPIPGRRADFITVRYSDNFQGRYRVQRGACSRDERYPDCADDRAAR
jgi:hypothetical protein